MKCIIFPGELNIRKGGPAGYIANLECGLKLIKQENEINIISKPKSSKENAQIRSKLGLVKSIIGKSNFLVEKISERNAIKRRYANINDQLNNINFTNKDFLHVHNVLDFNSILEYGFPAKIILTPHTPESIVDEYIDAAKYKFSNSNLKLNKYKEKIKSIEKSAFERCEYFIFPSKSAMEIYSTFIDDFDNIMKNKKIYYNLTGCKKLDYKLQKNEFKEIYNIPDSAFVVSYVGRHNKIKGYDIFIEVAKEIEKLDKDIIFISGGTGDIETKSKNVIEIGWTDDPGSIINASDLFLLPNRNTYFDLVLLEVLSIGTPVLASDTGGNKTVSELTKGISLFESENVEEIVSSILNLKNKQSSLEEMKKENLACYSNHFTLEKFAERYLKILDEIN
ncbi:glycosyl transferase family 1 [Bacillus cereus]|nr:glycosyl transferase family 1 [Bacillus cereus]